MDPTVLQDRHAEVMILRIQGKHVNGFDGVDPVVSSDDDNQGVGFPIWHIGKKFSRNEAPENQGTLDNVKNWIKNAISPDDPTVALSIAKAFQTDYPANGFNVFEEMTVIPAADLAAPDASAPAPDASAPVPPA